MKNYKSILITLLTITLSTSVWSQSIGINSDSSPPDSSAMLDVSSSNKGVLFPRLSNEEMSLIEEPAQGLMVYNLDEKALYMMKDGSWVNASSSNGGYWLSGNNGIYYENRTSVGGIGSTSMLNVHNAPESEIGEGLKVNNYYNGILDKSAAHFYSSNNGSGKVHGVKAYTESSTSAETYGVYSNVAPGNTTGDSYAIYGKIEPIGNTGTGEQWAGFFDGDTYVDKALQIGDNSNSNTGRLRVLNGSEATGAYISNTYTGESQTNGLSVNLIGNRSNQNGVLSNLRPNTDPTKTAIGFSSSMGTLFGTSGAAGKTVIGFNANFTAGVFGNKYGIKVNAKGNNNWAGYFDGRGLFSEQFFVGALPDLAIGAANINNNLGNIAALSLQSSSGHPLAEYGLFNGFSANEDGDQNFAYYTHVTGGVANIETFGHYIEMQGASGIKFGYYVNNPGAANWASYFNGRSYISEKLLVGSTTGKPGYMVSVDGKMACEEVLVELSQDWPDYVFESNYKLLTLEELEESIIVEGHLPGIPSAKEVESEGLKVGDMQTKMMEKIEELTLYIIQLNKENSALNARLEQLEKNDK